MNIILVGLMCSGKTECGMRLAEKTGLQFIDCDRMFELQYGSIDNCFAQGRHNFYRNEEKELINTLSDLDGLIIATGGGSYLDDEYAEKLKKLGKIVYLVVSPEVVVERAIADKRAPASMGKSDLIEHIRSVAERVCPRYEESCTFSINTENLTAVNAADEISKFFKLSEVSE